jgi:acetyl-CoA carboxylase carboxyl transferase subunit beta
LKEFFKRSSKPEATGAAENGESDEHAPKFAWKKPPDSSKTDPKADSTHDIPDDLWIKCTKCKELIYTKEFENNKKVCTKCGYHVRLSARERIAQLLDEGSFEELDAHLITADPLGFTSLTEPPYYLKAEQTRLKTGVNEALLTGVGLLEGLPLAVAVCDFSFQGGSMGGVFGEKLVRLIETAMARNIPVLTVSASGGARMHEGLFSLMQMAKTTAALARLGDRRLPHFSLFTDPTLGGVSASYASVADVILAEPGAVIGFAGQRVIEQTTRQKLPPGFQSAEFLQEHGMLDLVVPRRELRTILQSLIKVYNLAYSQYERYRSPEVALEVAYAG